VEHAPVIGQKNSVEIFINSLEKAFRSYRIYDYSSGQNTFESILENVLGALEKSFSESEQIEIDVKPFEMLHERKVIYSNKERKTSLAYALYQDGIRVLIFRRGMEKPELKEILNTLGVDFKKPEFVDEDLYCLFIERNFLHFQVIGGDALQEAFEKTPELKVEMDAIESAVRMKVAPVQNLPPRKLRAEDLKVLEEFRLNPAQFARSDEEIAKVIEGIIASREGVKKERETLERLLLMGFHFLIHDKGSGDQTTVGRDLVSRISLLALSAELFDLSQAVVSKIYQLQKDRIDRAGEYQKILDGIFNPDHSHLYRDLLKKHECEGATTKFLLQGPPSVFRLVVLLLGEHPPLGKSVVDLIHRQVSSHTTWIIEEIKKNPTSESWEQLINIMALKPTLQFQKILETLITTCGPSVKAKVLKQLAVLGTPEAIRIFEGMLHKGEVEERIAVYDLLAQTASKSALRMLRAHLDSARFKDVNQEEREAAYASVARMGGELALPWFEGLWNMPGTGLFKKKSEIERRSTILRALGRAGAPLVQTFIAKIPADSIVDELKLILQRMNIKKVGGRQ